MKTTSEWLQTSPADTVNVMNERPAARQQATRVEPRSYVPWIFTGFMGFLFQWKMSPSDPPQAENPAKQDSFCFNVYLHGKESDYEKEIET